MGEFEIVDGWSQREKDLRVVNLISIPLVYHI